MPYDNCESLFTKVAPTKEILRRVKQLAVSFLKIFHDNFVMNSKFDVIKLFVPNLDGYNVLIHLDGALNSRRFERNIVDLNDNDDQEEKMDSTVNLEANNINNKIPIVGFDPVRFYLNELRVYIYINKILILFKY